MDSCRILIILSTMLIHLPSSSLQNPKSFPLTSNPKSNDISTEENDDSLKTKSFGIILNTHVYSLSNSVERLRRYVPHPKLLRDSERRDSKRKKHLVHKKRVHNIMERNTTLITTTTTTTVRTITKKVKQLNLTQFLKNKKGRGLTFQVETLEAIAFRKKLESLKARYAAFKALHLTNNVSSVIPSHRSKSGRGFKNSVFQTRLSNKTNNDISSQMTDKEKKVISMPISAFERKKIHIANTLLFKNNSETEGRKKNDGSSIRRFLEGEQDERKSRVLKGRKISGRTNNIQPKIDYYDVYDNDEGYDYPVKTWGDECTPQIHENDPNDECYNYTQDFENARRLYCDVTDRICVCQADDAGITAEYSKDLEICLLPFGYRCNTTTECEPLLVCEIATKRDYEIDPEIAPGNPKICRRHMEFKSTNYANRMFLQQYQIITTYIYIIFIFFIPLLFNIDDKNKIIFAA